jgi:MFS family permease
MAFKKSNPGKTMLILLGVVVVLMLIMQLLTLTTAITMYKVASYDEDDLEDDIQGPLDAAEDAILAMCGICMFWPVALLYSGVAFGLTLIGRDVYGKKHSISAIIGFIVGISGVLFALVGTFMSMIIFGVEVGLPVSITIPIILISVGVFLFIKDVGGLILGAFGVGITSLSQLALCGVLIAIFQSDFGDDVSGMIMAGIFIILMTIVGLLLLGVAMIISYIWMGKNAPLLDEQQEQQLQMQQHQLSVQQEQLGLQKQQLQLQQRTYETIGQGQKMEYIARNRKTADGNAERGSENERGNG